MSAYVWLVSLTFVVQAARQPFFLLCYCQPYLFMATATEASLAFLVLCLYANLGRQRKSLHGLLLLTLAMLLGTAVAGALQLLLHPCFSAALFLTLRGVHSFISWTTLYTAQRSVRCNFGGDRVSRASKRRERRKQKIYAKRQRALIFAFGGSTLKWFERILRCCVFIATVIPIIVMILMAFKILKCSVSFIWSLHVSFQFLAKCFKAGLNISGLDSLQLNISGLDGLQMGVSRQPKGL